LYGSTQYGGTLFRVGTNGTFTKLHDFKFTEGSQPSAALVVGPDGALYGLTAGGGGNTASYGTLFRVDTKGTFSKRYST
jgi:uncharacterized repeat protein (TIGR03803 family)